MLKNYFKIAWRNIVKTPFYSLVNIIGLSVGIAFTLITAAYVWSELAVNADLKNADNQYILQSKWKTPNMGIELTTLAPLAKALREQYPNLVANYYREDGVSSIVSKGEKHFRESLQPGDSTLLSMYGFSLSDGNAATAFNDPFSVVITEEKAIKYFGRTDVVGQTLTIESMSGTKHDFMISGVMKKRPKNSVTAIINDSYNQFYLPPGSLKFFGRDMTSWANPYIAGYIELQKSVKPEDLKKPLQQLIKQNAPAQISDNLTPYLIPLKEYYRRANNGMVQKMIYTLSFTALFILLMAAINFINMTVSRSASRMKEIGIRKVLGGLRKQLIMQFLVESIVLVLFATGFALLIYTFSRPLMNEVLGKEVPPLSSFPIYFILISFLFAVIVGLFAGIYPAFVLSSLKEADSLKGQFRTIKGNILLRKSLVAFQFCIASVVFIAAIIISQQVSFFFSKDLGYNKDYVVTAQVPRDWSGKGVSRMETIRNEFMHLNAVSEASLSYEIPNGNNIGYNTMFKAGQDSLQEVAVRSLVTDEKFAATYQIPLAAGQFFNAFYGTYNSANIVINEAAAQALKWTAPEAIGKQVRVQGFPAAFKIAGVVKDFHFGSMHENIKPVWFMNVKNRNVYRYLSLKVKPGNLYSTLKVLQKKWSELMPGSPFEYNFMDDTLKELYQSELQLKRASYIASILAIIIVLLGILGLISLNIQRRTKEIGIRKILGSSVAGIIVLFMKEFLSVILIAASIACPLAYIIMHNWLNEYAYRINISAYPFVISILFLGFIIALLIGIQSIKAALGNPVKSLRSE